MLAILPKFKFTGKPLVLNAPVDLQKEFIEAGFTSSLVEKVKSQNTLIFINNHKEFTSFLSKQLKKIEFDSVLWFAYPKGTSKIKTDINRDILWATGMEYGIDAVSAISINEIWSALRFRPVDQVGKKKAK